MPTSTIPHFFLQARCPCCCPTNSVKALKATYHLLVTIKLLFEQQITGEVLLSPINAAITNAHNNQTTSGHAGQHHATERAVTAKQNTRDVCLYACQVYHNAIHDLIQTDIYAYLNTGLTHISYIFPHSFIIRHLIFVVFLSKIQTCVVLHSSPKCYQLSYTFPTMSGSRHVINISHVRFYKNNK